MEEEQKVFEFSDVPEIYADGIGSIVPCGPNVKLQLWTWREVNSVVQRVAVATIIRPFDTLVLSQDAVLRRVQYARARMLQTGIWHAILLMTLDFTDLGTLVLHY